jgi:hypothetical protein
MNKIYRHGEIAFLKIDKLPKSLVESKTNIIVSGSHGNAHTFRGGKLYLKKEGEYIIGYLKAQGTLLYHNEHSPKGVNIPNGNYEVRKQQEFINGELKQVID